MSTRVYVGLGANLGDRGAALLQALQRMGRWSGTRLLAVSSLYSSAPVEATGPDYLNAVALLETQMSAQEFLGSLQVLELQAGRERPYRNAPRTLDLDVLLWGQEQFNTPTLVVPHPRMWQRAFVLHPLAELDADQVTREQLQLVRDQQIQVLEPPQWATAAFA